MEFDLLTPDPEVESQKHKLKRLVQKPNSYFIDIKCKNKQCNDVKFYAHTFSHAQSVIRCPKCNEVLARPTGGKLELVDGVHVKRKGE